MAAFVAQFVARRAILRRPVPHRLPWPATVATAGGAAMNDTEKLQWLYDVEQIKQLKHRYCAYCDEAYDPDGIAALFVEDGVWDGGPFGRYEGRAAIHAFFAGASAQ